MTDAVERTLQAWRQSDFEYGTRDCLLSLADYVLERTGYDGGAPFRGRYSDEDGARRILADHGGAVAVFDRAPPLRVTVQPARGDIVLFEASAGDYVGAICTGRGIAARRERGTVEIDLRFVRVVRAWKVGQECQ